MYSKNDETKYTNHCKKKVHTKAARRTRRNLDEVMSDERGDELEMQPAIEFVLRSPVLGHEQPAASVD